MSIVAIAKPAPLTEKKIKKNKYDCLLAFMLKKFRATQNTAKDVDIEVHTHLICKINVRKIGRHKKSHNLMQ